MILIVVPSFRKLFISQKSHLAMPLKYQSLGLLNFSITDISSGVQHFIVRTELFYSTELNIVQLPV